MMLRALGRSEGIRDDPQARPAALTVLEHVQADRAVPVGALELRQLVEQTLRVVLVGHVDGGGKIVPRRITGVSAKYQRQIAKSIKLARQLALLPYTASES